MSSLVGRRLIVSGRVQGVFYRASILEEANKLVLCGWVKNLPQGQVHIEVFGAVTEVQKLLDWCRKGPPMASVREVAVEEIPFREELSFQILF